MTDKTSGDKSGKPSDRVDLGKQLVDQTSHLLSKEAEQLKAGAKGVTDAVKNPGKAVGDGVKVGEQIEKRLEEVANAAFKSIEKLHKDFEDHNKKGDVIAWAQKSSTEFIDHTSTIAKHGTNEQMEQVLKMIGMQIKPYQTHLETLQPTLKNVQDLVAQNLEVPHKAP